VVAFGPKKTGDIGTVEDALARAIAQASAVGRWDIVAQLARELEARRLSAAGVRSLVDKRGTARARSDEARVLYVAVYVVARFRPLP